MICQNISAVTTCMSILDSIGQHHGPWGVCHHLAFLYPCICLINVLLHWCLFAWSPRGTQSFSLSLPRIPSLYLCVCWDGGGICRCV